MGYHAISKLTFSLRSVGRCQLSKTVNRLLTVTTHFENRVFADVPFSITKLMMVQMFSQGYRIFCKLAVYYKSDAVLCSMPVGFLKL